MKIAVTYDNGQVFQHFGKTQEFKAFEVEDGEVKSSHVIASNGAGHGALAGLLAGEKIDVLICGGIGGGAQSALNDAGIELYAGASGDVDAAVEAYLKGELVNAGVTCNHHGEDHVCGDHEEEHECHCHDHEEEDECHCHDDEEEGCDGSCGGCSGCGPAIEGKNVGLTVRTHYRGTFNDGSQFDSSYDRGEPLEFVCGAGMMIRGFDQAVANMEVGEKINVHLMPEEAYGLADPNAIFSIEIAQLPGSGDLEVGQQVYLTNQFGQPFPVKVTEKTEVLITFDANHEMAGKELNFEIELVEIV